MSIIIITIIIYPAARKSQNIEDRDLVTASNAGKRLPPLGVLNVLQLPPLTQGSLSPTKCG